MADIENITKRVVQTHGYLKYIILTNKGEEVDVENSMFSLEIIPDKIRIRSVTEFDLERTTHSSWNEYVAYLPPEERIIIEWIHDSLTATQERFHVIGKVLLSLRLFKRGSIFVPVIYDMVNNHKNHANKISSLAVPHPDDVFHDSYSLDTDDGPKLSKIVDKILNVDFDKEKSYFLACNRFGRYFYDLFNEDKLIDLCIGFEALFLQGARQGSDLGMGQVIGLACSMLLGENKKDRDKIVQHLRRSFTLRNDIVHGKEPKWKEVDSLLPILEEYMRKSLLKLMPVKELN